MTAGRRPPKVGSSTSSDTNVKSGSNPLDSDAKSTSETVAVSINIIRDGDNDEDDEIKDETYQSRLADDINYNSKTHPHSSVADAKSSSDRVTAKASTDSKLVKDILSRQAEQSDTVTNAASTAIDSSSSVSTGIRLLKRSNASSQQTRDNNSKGSSNNPTYAATESITQQLRESVQKIVTEVGPLGICLENIPDDLKSIAVEAKLWEEEFIK